MWIQQDINHLMLKRKSQLFWCGTRKHLSEGNMRRYLLGFGLVEVRDEEVSEREKVDIKKASAALEVDCPKCVCFTQRLESIEGYVEKMKKLNLMLMRAKLNKALCVFEGWRDY